ncbi:TPA: hypothetical protein DDZ86_00760 [Candidatus Dependentiae bacterium]|nr:hypothetical protein [Candidatus Dependentiae bacterium]
MKIYNTKLPARILACALIALIPTTTFSARQPFLHHNKIGKKYHTNYKGTSAKSTYKKTKMQEFAVFHVLTEEERQVKRLQKQEMLCVVTSIVIATAITLPFLFHKLLDQSFYKLN